MRITWNDLVVSTQDFTDNDLLSAWQWLLKRPVDLLLVSSLGNMFLVIENGRVLWLDVGSAELTDVASDVGEFRSLVSKPENMNQWFIPQLVGDLKESGMNLKTGQCYSYKVPPVLGGELQVTNFEPVDLSVHFSVLGQIHNQLKDLQPGTSVSKFKIE
jgi:hypothetical protein